MQFEALERHGGQLRRAELERVVADLLGPVHRRVGVSQESFGVLTVLGIRGHAGTCGHFEGAVLGCLEGAASEPEQLLGETADVLALAQLGYEDQELIP